MRPTTPEKFDGDVTTDRLDPTQVDSSRLTRADSQVYSLTYVKPVKRLRRIDAIWSRYHSPVLRGLPQCFVQVDWNCRTGQWRTTPNHSGTEKDLLRNAYTEAFTKSAIAQCVASCGVSCSWIFSQTFTYRTAAESCATWRRTTLEQQNLQTTRKRWKVGINFSE